MATGKRNKEGRKRRKEQERLEYLDHQKRRLENYIKAEVSFPAIETPDKADFADCPEIYKLVCKLVHLGG